jgi:hypothetical protein
MSIGSRFQIPQHDDHDPGFLNKMNMTTTMTGMQAVARIRILARCWFLIWLDSGFEVPFQKDQKSHTT